MKQLTAVIIGAGNRGLIYGDYALKYPDELKIVAIAEPDPERREFAARHYDLSGEALFNDWQDLFSHEKMADIAMICTQDQMHVEPARAAMNRGYHLLLEKPLAPTKEECRELYNIYKESSSIVAVAHVLRSTPFFRTLKELLESGVIGPIRGIQHNENIGHLHYAHSYVRGNWRNKEESSPIILAKSCHDMDILLYLTGSGWKKISSFASRDKFIPEKRPAGAPDRCTDGCLHRDDCPFYAPEFYINTKGWLKEEHAREIIQKLQHSPYGRCVYACDNDVVEHQVVAIEFENNIHAAFTMSAFTQETCRTIKIVGEEGEIRGHMERNEIEIFNFAKRRLSTIIPESRAEGHSGGDLFFVRDLLTTIRDPSIPLNCSLDGALESHMMAFAAEESREREETLSPSELS